MTFNGCWKNWFSFSRHLSDCFYICHFLFSTKFMTWLRFAGVYSWIHTGRMMMMMWWRRHDNRNVGPRVESRWHQCRQLCWRRGGTTKSCAQRALQWHLDCDLGLLAIEDEFQKNQDDWEAHLANHRPRGIFWYIMWLWHFADDLTSILASRSLAKKNGSAKSSRQEFLVARKYCYVNQMAVRINFTLRGEVLKKNWCTQQTRCTRQPNRFESIWKEHIMSWEPFAIWSNNTQASAHKEHVRGQHVSRLLCTHFDMCTKIAKTC